MKSNEQDYIKRAYKSIGIHCQAMLDLQQMGSVVFDYGNNIRGQANENANLKNAFSFACPLILLP
jgi:urocanate hydratase